MPTPNTISPADDEPIRRFLDGDYVALREHARDVLSRPEFTPVYGLAREQHREQTLARLKTLTRERLTVAALPTQYGGSDDVGASVAAYEMIAYADLNLSVKIGAHFVLARGAVQYVGTAKHHERYLPDMATLERPACAAMTEVGHGSNLQGMRTLRPGTPGRRAAARVHRP
jgi:acyl-CoA oxidase